MVNAFSTVVGTRNVFGSAPVTMQHVSMYVHAILVVTMDVHVCLKVNIANHVRPDMKKNIEFVMN